jgi:hypothetical protein
VCGMRNEFKFKISVRTFDILVFSFFLAFGFPLGSPGLYILIGLLVGYNILDTHTQRISY